MCTQHAREKKKTSFYNTSCPDQSWLFIAVACRRVGPPWSRQADCCSTWTHSSNLSWSHSCHGAAALKWRGLSTVSRHSAKNIFAQAAQHDVLLSKNFT